MNIWVVVAIAGLVGGLVAAFVMERVQALIAPLLGIDQSGDPATVKVADKARGAAGKPKVPEPYRMPAGAAVHYGTGTALGLAYAALVQVWPVAAIGFGAAFGAAVVLVLDDGVVPALGLGAWPWKSEPKTLVYGTASHIVFGLALEAVRRLVVARLG